MIICYTVPEIWCMMNVTVIFHFGLFLPFYPLNSLKKSKFKKMKRQVPRDIIIYKSVPKIMIICYTLPEIWHVMDVIVIFSFWAIFYPNSQKNQNYKKMKRTPEISSFYTCVPKIMVRWWRFLRYGMQQTDGQTDRWMDGGKKWHKEVGAHLKNIYFFIKL